MGIKTGNAFGPLEKILVQATNTFEPMESQQAAHSPLWIEPPAGHPVWRYP